MIGLPRLLRRLGSLHLFDLSSVGRVRSDRILHLPCSLSRLPFCLDLFLGLSGINVPLAVYVSFFEYLLDPCDNVRMRFRKVLPAIYIPGDVI